MFFFRSILFTVFSISLLSVNLQAMEQLNLEMQSIKDAPAYYARSFSLEERLAESPDAKIRAFFRSFKIEPSLFDYRMSDYEMSTSLNSYRDYYRLLDFYDDNEIDEVVKKLEKWAQYI